MLTPEPWLLTSGQLGPWRRSSTATLVERDFTFGLIRRQVAAFSRRDMSRREKAQSCLRTPQRAHDVSNAFRAGKVLRLGFDILLS
jgi:hypothetical protein